MKKSILGIALAGMMVWGGVANAGPLAPSLALTPTGDFVFGGLCGVHSCIAGEGAAVNTLIGQNPSVPDTAIQHLDWIVIHDNNVNGGYTYYYQLENSSIAALGGHTVATPTIGTSFVGAFMNLGVDLDLDGGPTVAGHNDTNFPNLFPPRPNTATPPQNGPLKAELELAQLALVGPSTAVVDFNGDLLVTFTAGLGVGEESGIYGAQGIAPVYGPWNTQGASFTWNSENFNPCTGGNTDCEQGVRVPVPGVPEPASLLLLGSGLAGLGFWARRRKN